MTREARRETRRACYHRRQEVQEVQLSEWEVSPLSPTRRDLKYANTDQEREGGERLEIPWPLRRWERMGPEQGKE